ncbi:MAG: hypothetical protein WCC66_10130 [Rhizobiaceae bacterium]
MKRIKWTLSLALSVLAGLQPGAAQPLDEIRSTLKILHKVQDDLAHGDTSVVAFQSELVARLKAGLAGMPEAAASREAYLETVFEFALSGGDPASIQKLLERTRPPQEQLHLFDAVKSYVDGNMEASAKAFDSADFDRAALRLLPYLELAKGTANLETGVETAKSSFETVVLLAPGTLLEEVALRRLVAISVNLKDRDLFLRCAHLYLRRYSQSPFFREFVRVLVLGTDIMESDIEFESLARKIEALQDDKSRPVFMAMVSKLVKQGRLEKAAIFLRSALTGRSEHTPTGRYGQIMALNEALIELKSAASVKHLAFFWSIDPSTLTPEDGEILEIGKHVVWNILRPISMSENGAGFYGPVRGQVEPSPAGTQATATKDRDDLSAAEEALRSAKAQLDAFDKILGQNK